MTLTHSEPRISIEWRFINIEDRQGQPIAEQRLLLDITTRVIGQPSPPYAPIYEFALHDLAAPFNSGTYQSGISYTYDPARTINGVAYSDVLEGSIRRDNSSYGPLSVPEADWVRIVIARGPGLVQFELRNGQVFTRM